MYKKQFITFLEAIKKKNPQVSSLVEAALRTFTVCFEDSHMIYHSDGDKIYPKLISNVSVDDSDDDKPSELVNDLMRQWMRALSQGNQFNKDFNREHIEYVLLSENPMLILNNENGERLSLSDNNIFDMIKSRVRELVNLPENSFIKNNIINKLKSNVMSARRAQEPQKAAYYEDQIHKLDPSIDIELKDIEGKVMEQDQAKKDAMVDMKDIADIVSKNDSKLTDTKKEQPTMQSIADIVTGKLSGDNEERKKRLAELDAMFR